VTLTAAGRATVEGTARTWPEGKPIAGARCGWRDASGDRDQVFPLSATSDVAGRFEVGVPAGQPVRVRCIASMGLLARDAVAEAPPDGSATVEVLLFVPKLPRNAAFPALQIGSDLRVSSVAPEAVAAGLAVGDVVIAVDGVQIEGIHLAAVLGLLTDRPAGAPAVLTVSRGSAVLTMAVPMPARLEVESE